VKSDATNWNTIWEHLVSDALKLGIILLSCGLALQVFNEIVI